MKALADFQSREDEMEFLSSVMKDIIKCANDGASTVQVSVSGGLDVKVEAKGHAFEPQSTNISIAVSNAESMSKDMVMALGSTLLSFIAMCGGAGGLEYECKALA